MVKVDKTNYHTYKKVFEIFWQHRFRLLHSQAASQPLNIDSIPSPVDLLSNVESKSMALALKSLRAGFADMPSMLRDAPHEFTAALNADLKNNGLPDCYALYMEAKDVMASVLKRQSILFGDEYYFIIEILNDTKSDLSAAERETLNTCVAEFEVKRTVKNKL